ncbi:MAG TPA: PAS domain-containing protein [Rhizomicrobium sp.]|nr:PAS domain-containing protein [Rhizomicrobium sp.]
MKHRNSHLLVGYWSRLRKGHTVPDQTDIDPRAIKRILPYVFILDASDAQAPFYRLAGTAHCERYGGELKGTGFLSRWEPQSRTALAAVLQQALTIQQPVCVSSLAASDEWGMVEVETVLLPLCFGSVAPSRFIGISQLLGDHAAMCGKPLTCERLVSSRFVPESGEPPVHDLPPPPSATVRNAGRAPHLRLVVSRDKAPVVRSDIDPSLQRLMEALEIAPLKPVRSAS